jgi:hypothetical protein
MALYARSQKILRYRCLNWSVIAESILELEMFRIPPSSTPPTRRKMGDRSHNLLNTSVTEDGTLC